MNNLIHGKKILLATLVILTSCALTLCGCHFGGTTRQRFDEEHSAEDSGQKYNTYPLSIAKDEQHTINGYLYLPNTDSSTYPLIIICHGINSGMGSTSSYADFYANNGIAAFVFDFIGGSKESASGGSMSEMSVLTEIDDLSAVYDYLQNMDIFDKNKIFLHGDSQGGLVSALYAANAPQKVAGLVLFYPAFVIPDFAREQYGNLAGIPDHPDALGTDTVGKKYFQDVIDMDPYAIIGNYDKNVLIIHGDADQGVPISYSQRAEKVYSHATLITMPGAGHGFLKDQWSKACTHAVHFVKGCLSNNS